jgi:hypothetical protein
MPIQKRTSQTKRERQTMRVELVSRTWSCLTCKKAAVTRDALRWLCTCTPAAMCWEETVPEPRPPITDAEVAEELERIADEEEMRETEKERIQEEFASQVQPEVLKFDDDSAFADHLEISLDELDDDEETVTAKEKNTFVNALIERLETPGEYSLQNFVADQHLTMRKAKPLILSVLRAHRSWSRFTVTERRAAMRTR